MVQQDIIINVKYKTDKEGNIEKVTERTIKNIQLMGDKIKTTTTKFVGHRKVMEGVSVKYRRFRAELLSVMFFGYALQRVFKGLTSASLEMAGVFDVLNTFLGMAFLPIGMFLLDVVLWLWDAWDALPEPVQNFINAIAGIIGIAGTIIGGLAGIALGVKGLKLAMEGFTIITPILSSAWLGPFLLAVAAALLIWIMFGDDIKDLTRNTWRYVNAVIKGNTQEAAVYWELLSKRIQIIGLKMMEYAAAPFIALAYLIYKPLVDAYNLIANFFHLATIKSLDFKNYMTSAFDATNKKIAELEREIGITEKSIGGYETAAINAANTTNTLGSNTNLATKEMELFKTYMDAAKGSADMMTDSLGDIDYYLRQVNASAREAAAALNTVANVTGMTPSGFMSKEEWVRKQAAKGAIISPSLMPFLQHGGLVTKPTPALIGERGPEAVIPLDRIGSIGGINITINTSTIGSNTDQIAREIAEKFSFELSRVRY